ncbi:MAG: hypothetical protein IPM95_04995 [Sphingobacteriales bacterium]|nr:hypothetical protein [Sphingobacteriales bacterium]
MRQLFCSYALLILLSASAENKLLLCSSYSESGEYSGVFPSWNITQDGSYMHLFYESDTPVNDTLSVLIFKTFDRRDTNFYEYDRYYLLPGPSKEWAANKYTFRHPGNYRFLVFDLKKDLLLQSYNTLLEFENSVYDSHFTDTWYYLNTQLTFCDSVVKGNIIGRKNSFTYNPNGTKVVVYIGQGNQLALKSDHILAKIYKIEGAKRTWIKSNPYYTEFSWYWTYLPIYLNERGNYLVELYNEQDVYINSAALEIK